jgi:hypothetical protein
MALIKTIAEVQAVLPKLVSNLNKDSAMPNFDAVEEKYLVDIIGQELYADLQTKYDDNTLEDEEKVLLKHINLVTASYGFMEEQAATHVFFTDDGIRVSATSDMPKAVGWEYKALKTYLNDKALDGIEVLLKYLWKHKDDLPKWTASTEYKQFEKGLIRTGTDFSNQYTLYQPMRTFFLMKSTLDDVQDEYIESPLGSDLLEYFAELEAPTDEEISIIRKLKKALAFFTVKRYAEHHTVLFSASGFTVISMFGGDRETDDSGRAAAAKGDIEKQTKACEREGKNFMARAKNEIVKLSQKTGAPADFLTAFETSPLKKYVDPKDQTSGNEKRRFFRF